MDESLAHEIDLGRFDEVSGKIVPDKIVDRGCGLAEIEMRQQRRDAAVASEEKMEAIKQFVAKDAARVGERISFRIDGALQRAEAADVPKLVTEVTTLLDLLLVEANVDALRRDANQTKSAGRPRRTSR